LNLLKTIFLILIALLLVFWGYRTLFPSDHKIIRKKLEEMAGTVSFSPDDSGIRRLAKQNKLPGYFSRDVVVNVMIPDGSVQTLRGRDDLLVAYQVAQRNVRRIQVRFLDVQLQFAPGKETATAHLTVLADINNEKNALAQELQMDLTKIDGDWFISQIDTVETITRYR
jgi:hypothetical protein